MRHKKYISYSQSRFWSMEIPIGDPHGGPAYGEKCGPVLAVAAVVASASEVATVGLTIASGMALAGSALGLVGMVTGDKTLSTIGGLVGLGGAAASLAGVGSTDLSSMFSSSGTTTVGDAGNAAADATASANPDVLTNAAPADSGIAGSQTASSSGTVNAAASSTGVTPIAGDASSALGADSSTALTGSAPIDPLTGQPTQVPSSATDPTGTVANQVSPMPGDNAGTTMSANGSDVGNYQANAAQNVSSTLGNGTASTVESPVDQSNISKISQWMNNNKVMVDVGGKFISGMMSQLFPTGLTQAQTALYAQQAASMAQNSSIQAQQFANANNASQLNANSINPAVVNGNTSTVYANNPSATPGILNRATAPKAAV